MKQGKTRASELLLRIGRRGKRMAATSLLKGKCAGISVRQLFPFAHPHRPLNFNQINSAVNHNYHHIRIRRGKLTLSPSPRLATLWNSSSPFCTAADASAAASASASEVVSDAAVVDEAVPVSEVVHEQKKIKDAADLLDIRVGRVLKAWRHEEADSLYVEEVDVGEPEPRIICSGLVRYIPLDHLQDRNVVVLANLKPRNMRGVKSNGMLMAASDASHENVELLVPPEGSLPGERVWFGSEEDHLNQPPAASPNQLQKKKIWELVQPHMKTDNSCIALLGEHVMRTSAGVVISTSLKNANIS
ncbi:hypothetical protein ACFX13_006820 [Malus domestica]|uniref:uncharacterized protein LOC126591112 n=1 Tax=Malus sylvestris TaxID=3752 RepID=UPI0021AC6F1F|nr:uncharacterized protein LOC126591112 [Malus sylvestris]